MKIQTKFDMGETVFIINTSHTAKLNNDCVQKLFITDILTSVAETQLGVKHRVQVLGRSVDEMAGTMFAVDESLVIDNYLTAVRISEQMLHSTETLEVSRIVCKYNNRERVERGKTQRNLGDLYNGYKIVEIMHSLKCGEQYVLEQNGNHVCTGKIIAERPKLITNVSYF